MWDIKLKLRDTDNSIVVTRGKGVEGSRRSNGPNHGDGKLFDVG